MPTENLVKFKPQEMKNSGFYLLRLLPGTDFASDRIESLVVVACTSHGARLLAEAQAKERAGDNEPAIWLDNKRTSCKVLGKWQYKRPSVIITDEVNG